MSFTTDYLNERIDCLTKQITECKSISDKYALESEQDDWKEARYELLSEEGLNALPTYLSSDIDD